MNCFAPLVALFAAIALTGPGLAQAQTATAAPDLAAQLKAAGIVCTVSAQAAYGSTSEAACAEGMGYLLLPGTPPKAITCADLAAQEDSGKLIAACSLTANREPLALIDTILGKTGISCKPVARTYVGADDSRYYFEVVCDTGKGFVLSQAKTGDGPSAIYCNAQFMSGAVSCDLTKGGLAAAKTAETHRLALLNGYFGAGMGSSTLASYAAAAKANGLDCNLGPMTRRGSTADIDVIEFRCANKDDGRIGVFSKKGAPAKVYDCASAKIVQLTCELTKELVGYPVLNADIRTLDYRSECRVKTTRLLGLSQNKQTAYLEVACVDPNLDGQVLAFNTDTLKLLDVVDCSAVPLTMGGGCRIAGAKITIPDVTAPSMQSIYGSAAPGVSVTR